MATGKKANELWTRTVTPADISREAAPRRPVKAAEGYDKVTVDLYARQTLWLDELALALRKHTGRKVKRVDLIRALVDHAAADIDLADAGSLHRAARELLGDEAAAVH